MQKGKLIRCEDKIFRILDVDNGFVLIVNCVHKSVPKWIEKKEVSSYEDCSEEEMISDTGVKIRDYDSLSKEERRLAHEHFTLIAGVLPFIGDDRVRCLKIKEVIETKGISKQTVNYYLWLYLAYQDIAALAPKQKDQEKELTKNEKNMRWALNKYFYTRHKNTLTTAYTMMLKEKYCDTSGVLLQEYPSIHQFRYFYKKYNKLQNYYISRDGLKDYQRNHRPLLGEGVQDFAPAIGTAMLDSTTCDIYLVNESGNLVGRPILVACIDAYSGLCCGYSLSWEGGLYSLRNLMINVISDKVDWCKRFGINISKEDWDCDKLPATLVTDMGVEYTSGTFEQIAELGVTVVNLPPYRPELKGVVEKFFDLVQESYKKHLKGKGVIEADYQERGVRDYRKDACLTMFDFEKIVLHCILYYNSKRIIEEFPFTKQMIEEQVEPYSNAIWNWSKEQSGSNLIAVEYGELVLTLLPRTVGKFGRDGLKVNKLKYVNDKFTEYYLRGEELVVAYNPDDVTIIWLLEKGEYTEFKLAESRFSGFKMEEVEILRDRQKNRLKTNRTSNLQAQIDLASHIEAIANAATKSQDTSIKDIRKTRKKEQSKNHIDFVRGGAVNE